MFRATENYEDFMLNQTRMMTKGHYQAFSNEPTNVNLEKFYSRLCDVLRLQLNVK